MPRGGTAGGSKKSSNISYQRPSEPSFLRKIKEQVGYKDAVSIDSKRAMINQDFDADDGREDDEDEQPTIVVLKEGDLTEEQVKAEKEKKKDDDEAPQDGRIMFKKPSGKKRDKGDLADSDACDVKKKKKDKKAEKNLLSFEDDDDN